MKKMKKYRVEHGTYNAVRKATRIMRKKVNRKTTNNYRKMHGKPMRRKCGEKKTFRLDDWI